MSRTIRDEEELVEKAVAGDRAAFSTLVDPDRVRLFRHCYRMLGSGQEAEDAVQDSLLRAWKRVATFAAKGRFYGWLVRIATNECLDRLRGRTRRAHPVSFCEAATVGEALRPAGTGVDWIEPVADHLLTADGNPESMALQRERVSFAFVAALHRLSPRQRAALLLHDVLEFSQAEVAEVLRTTTGAVNNLLYRARLRIKASPLRPAADPDDPAVERLVARYQRAFELADIEEFIATVSDDVTFSMPPLLTWYRGSTDVAAFVEAAILAPARPVGLLTRLGRANGHPTVAIYEVVARDPLLTGMQILEVDVATSLIGAVTSFRDQIIALRCGFPERLPLDGPQGEPERV